MITLYISDMSIMCDIFLLLDKGHTHRQYGIGRMHTQRPLCPIGLPLPAQLQFICDQVKKSIKDNTDNLLGTEMMTALYLSWGVTSLYISWVGGYILDIESCSEDSMAGRTTEESTLNFAMVCLFVNTRYMTVSPSIISLSVTGDCGRDISKYYPSSHKRGGSQRCKYYHIILEWPLSHYIGHL